MVRHLENTTSTTSMHHVRDLWKSPRGTVIRIQTLAVVAMVITFFLVAFGSCRRWSSRWIVQKGFFAAHALSLSLGTYSIGLMQSSSARSEMYPIWTVSLFTLFGCIDPVTTYNGFDYKGPLSKVVYLICLYCGYALLMSISGLSSVVGNTAICMLSAITFIKGFHRTLALVQQSRMRNTIARLGDDYTGQTNILRHRFIDDMASEPDSDEEKGSNLIVEFGSGTDNPHMDHVRIKDVVNTLLPSKKEEGVVNKLLPSKKKDELQSWYDVCVAYSLSHSLQRHFLGLTSRKVRPQPLEGVDYKWTLEVVEMELAFLHDVFFSGNAFLHYYQAKTACLWALASFIGICFVGVAAAIPGAIASSRGGFATIVDTTTADLVITFAILVSLALLQLMQLVRCWTSNWARLAVACAYARIAKEMEQTRKPLGWRALWIKLIKSSKVMDKVRTCIKLAEMWMSLRWFLATRTNWFDKHYLWQEKIGQYPLLSEGEKEAEDGVSLTVGSDYRANRGCGKMLGLDYIWLVLWDLLGSDADKRYNVSLHEDVKDSITDFLRQIKDGILEGSWTTYPGHSDIEALFLPYACAPQLDSEPQGRRYTRCVLAWCVVTWHCELAEQAKEGGGHSMGTNASKSETAAATEAPAVQEEERKKKGKAEEGGGSSIETDHASNLEKAEAPAAGPEVGGERDKNRNHRLVANALAKYCAYLVVSLPELLPGLVLDTRRACDFFAETSSARSPQDKGGLLEKVSDPTYWVKLYNIQGSYDEFREVRNAFYDAAARSLDAVTERKDRWKVLADVWVRMLVYAAPYGNVEVHMRQLSQGGEFITHLWALLYHLSIRQWKPSGSKNKPLQLGGLLTAEDKDKAKAESIINDFTQDNEAVVVAYLHYDMGFYSAELDAASQLVKGVRFYRTTRPEIAMLFKGLATKRPSLVLLKKGEEEEEEKFTFYDRDFDRYAIAHFVSRNKLPLVTTLTQKTVPSLHGHPIQKMIILLAVANESSKFLPDFKKAAKLFKGKLVFVFVDRDNEDAKQAARNFFRIISAGQETKVLAYTREENIIIPLDGQVSLHTNNFLAHTQKFAKDFDEDKLHESDPAEVQIVVGHNFDKIVLDESKDVLLVVICELRHRFDTSMDEHMDACNKLAQYMRGIKSLVVAKMDGTANWHPRARKYNRKETTSSSATVLFYPAKRKPIGPITFEGQPSAKELYKFIKKHADISFNPISTLEEVSTENGGQTGGEIAEEIPPQD